MLASLLQGLKYIRTSLPCFDSAHAGPLELQHAPQLPATLQVAPALDGSQGLPGLGLTHSQPTSDLRAYNLHLSTSLTAQGLKRGTSAGHVEDDSANAAPSSGDPSCTQEGQHKVGAAAISEVHSVDDAVASLVAVCRDLVVECKPALEVAKEPAATRAPAQRPAPRTQPRRASAAAAQDALAAGKTAHTRTGARFIVVQIGCLVCQVHASMLQLQKNKHSLLSRPACLACWHFDQAVFTQLQATMRSAHKKQLAWHEGNAIRIHHLPS